MSEISLMKYTAMPNGINASNMLVEAVY